MNRTSIVLADSLPIALFGLRALIQSESRLQVVGETTDGSQLAELLEHEQPDMLIVDVSMPGFGLAGLTRSLQRPGASLSALVLSEIDSRSYMLDVIRAGASGVLLKKSPRSEIFRAINEVASGGRFLGAVNEKGSTELHLNSRTFKEVDPYETLTGRESQVLILAVGGKTNAQIAELLSISMRTVETHRGHLMHKLGLHNQTELVRFALRRGLLSAEK